MLGKCWKWSGCPLVVLVAVPMLIVQTRDLAGPFTDYQNQSGVRNLWYRLTDQFSMPFGLGLPSIPPFFTIHTEAECCDIYPPRISHTCDTSVIQGQCYSWGAHRPTLEYRGIWAITSRYSSFLLPRNYNHQPPLEMSSEDFESVMQYLAEEYKEWYFVHGWRYDPLVFDQLMAGRAEWGEPIYSGYAHNALALFLLGTTGRGLIGTRRWWRALRARLRTKKNRCVVCGYNLRGQTRGRCPVCGVLIPDRHAEVYTEREKIPGIESGVFNVAAAGRGSRGDQSDQDEDRAGGDEPQAGG